MVHVQALLFASLSASLFAAFLAMLGKQWLNLYNSSDVRGSAIERSHNRQRKLSGMDAWYFSHVIESLPLMLQASLLLLGCALSRYLWGVSILVASVILGVTCSGVCFYIFIVVAGVADESCPYQTPASMAFRYLGKNITGIIHRLWRKFINWVSKTVLGGKPLTTLLHTYIPRRFRTGGMRPLLYLFFPPLLICGFVWGVFRLGWAMAQEFGSGARDLVHKASRMGLEQRSKKQETLLDLGCISWTLQTSLDKDVRLLAVEYLAMKTKLDHFDPTLVIGPCFDVLVGCISFNGRKIEIMPDKGRLATVSATCFLRSLRQLSRMGQASSVLADIRQRYSHAFQLCLDFAGIPFYHTMIEIHSLAKEFKDHRGIKWDDYRPSDQEYITFSRCMVVAARLEYGHRLPRKVPRWILRFALHSLSLDPLPPVPVVTNCLTIVAIELGLQVLDVAGLEERCVRIVRASAFLTKIQGRKWSKSSTS